MYANNPFYKKLFPLLLRKASPTQIYKMVFLTFRSLMQLNLCFRLCDPITFSQWLQSSPTSNELKCQISYINFPCVLESLIYSVRFFSAPHCDLGG